MDTPFMSPVGVQGPALLDRCIRFARAYTHAVRRVDARLSALHGLSFGDYMILHHLQCAHGSRLRRTDLAELLGLTASAVTKSLIPLEKIGLVARESEPRDARVGYASLTPAGARLLADALSTAELACLEAYQAVEQEWLGDARPAG